jgi:hypothetical protein
LASDARAQSSSPPLLLSIRHEVAALQEFWVAPPRCIDLALFS